MNDKLKIEVPFVFYECFQLAIKSVNKHNAGKLVIVKENKNETNGFVIEVKSENVLDFYHLGSRYATFKGNL